MGEPGQHTGTGADLSGGGGSSLRPADPGIAKTRVQTRSKRDSGPTDAGRTHATASRQVVRSMDLDDTGGAVYKSRHLPMEFHSPKALSGRTTTILPYAQ